MQGASSQLGAMFKRKDVQYSLLFMLLYLVWIIWPIYGLMPFFAFTMLIVFKYMKTRKALRRLTFAARNQFPQKLPEDKWEMLLSYAFPIYAPKDAYALGQVFRICELGGYVCLAALAFQQRWADVMACFSVSMFALQMQRTLQPEKFFEKWAKKKPDEYGPKLQAIRNLQKWVLSDDAP